MLHPDKVKENVGIVKLQLENEILFDKISAALALGKKKFKNEVCSQTGISGAGVSIIGVSTFGISRAGISVILSGIVISGVALSTLAFSV
jgi:hypothetical protein